MKPMHPWTVDALCLATARANAAEPAGPAKPVRAIVPVAAGSSTDIVARIVLEQLSLQVRQPILVENRTGAGGKIGSAFVAKAEADLHVQISTLHRRLGPQGIGTITGAATSSLPSLPATAKRAHR